MLTQSWIQLDVGCDAGQAESLGALLMEAGALGIHEREQPDGPTLTAYFEHPIAEAHRLDVERILARFYCESFAWTVHKDDGWSTRWQEHFKPLEVGERLVICPSWESYEPKPAQKILRLDPGMAFGTGQHATTKGSLLLMERYLQPDTVVLDVGCGSGILSLAALLIGASHAVGVDIDADSITVALENAALNHLSESVEFSTTPIADVLGRYPLVLANIQAHILLPMAPLLVPRVQPQGTLLLSGILDTKRDIVVQTYLQRGCFLKDEYLEDGWFSLVFGVK